MNTPYRIPKKIAMFNSFAGYGRCAMTEAVPVISAMQVQACPVPTAVFSSHTGFPSYYAHDFSPALADYLAQWELLDLRFDGVYCGFLGKKRALQTIGSFIEKQKEKKDGISPVVLIDPVMGDHGRRYRTVTPDYCAAMRRFIRMADLITPNITEACLLADIPCREENWTREQLRDLCVTLHALGPSKVVITGLYTPPFDKPGYYTNFVSEKDPDSGEAAVYEDRTPFAGAPYHGTGDLFAAVLAADAIKGVPLPASVQKAAAFIGACIKTSHDLQIPETDGVCFENFLFMLQDPAVPPPGPSDTPRRSL